jgi:hypothetical protein
MKMTKPMLGCLLSGYKVPLSKDSLATLYPTHERAWRVAPISSEQRGRT